MSNPFSKYKNHKQLNSYLSCILKIYNSNYEKKTPKLSNTRTVVNKNTSLHIYIECDENKIKLNIRNKTLKKKKKTRRRRRRRKRRRQNSATNLVIV